MAKQSEAKSAQSYSFKLAAMLTGSKSLKRAHDDCGAAFDALLPHAQKYRAARDTFDEERDSTDETVCQKGAVLAQAIFEQIYSKLNIKPGQNFSRWRNILNDEFDLMAEQHDWTDEDSKTIRVSWSRFITVSFYLTRKYPNLLKSYAAGTYNTPAAPALQDAYKQARDLATRGQPVKMTTASVKKAVARLARLEDVSQIRIVMAAFGKLQARLTEATTGEEQTPVIRKAPKVAQGK
jgi:hypothetical protein